GSYVPQGVEISEWVSETAGGVKLFYDIDTRVTLAKLERGENDYLTPELIPCYDMYLSFTSGPTLERIERQYGSPAARPLYCSFDPEAYYPKSVAKNWDLGYMGTYSDDRQRSLHELLIEPARRLPERRFVVAGPQYPETITWAENIELIEHLPPQQHCDFYNAQRFTLNITRADMIQCGV